MDRSYAIEIVYRGIFQKTLAKHISRGLVLAASKEGKTGISFGRYGDSPERNGIPAKNFAIIAPDDETLEESMAQYEPKRVDVTVNVDDTMCKGVESWAWYGLQPINRLLNPNGKLIVTSMLGFDDLLKMIHTKETPYELAIVRAVPSFSGLWVYKDDHTDVRILGTIARLVPDMLSIDAVEKAIKEEWKDDLKVLSARKAYERVESVVVPPGAGNAEVPYEFTLPGWREMREGVTIDSIPMGGAFVDPETGKTGGYRPARNPYFKKFSTRTMRPVVNFDTCIKCTLCWLQCPDSCFDVTPDWQPVLGPVAEVPGLHLAAGFSGHGFKLSPALGEVLDHPERAARMAQAAQALAASTWSWVESAKATARLYETIGRGGATLGRAGA